MSTLACSVRRLGYTRHLDDNDLATLPEGVFNNLMSLEDLQVYDSIAGGIFFCRTRYALCSLVSLISKIWIYGQDQVQTTF